MGVRGEQHPILGGGGAKAMVEKEFLDRVLGNRLEEDEEGVAEPWLNSSFVTFCRCLGMPSKGFEGEILLLLKMMKERKELKGNLARKRRKVQKTSRSERELKKIKCSMNYSGAKRCGGALQLAK